MPLQLTWLEIRKFRNVKPCRLEFSAGHNVLLGLNATGKTTLLELVCACLNGDFSAFSEEAYDVAWECAGTRGRLVRCEANSARATDGDTAGSWRPSWQVKVSDSSREWSSEHYGPGQPPSGRGWLTFVMGIEHLIESRLTKNTRRFDEVLGFFDELTSSAMENADPPTAHTSGSGDDFFSVVSGAWPRGMAWRQPLGQVSSSVPADLERDIEVSAPEVVGLLERANAAFGTEAIKARLKWQSGSDVGTRHRGLAFRLVEEHRRYHHQQMSFGQKRLLSFFYYAACVEVVVADELVNGLHHQWIEACVAEIGDKQSFLTSQNPLLIDHLQLENAQQTQKMFLICRRDGAQLVWEHMDAETAAEVFADREVGIQHTSEILKVRNLW
jgi:ABC-type molybdenum transport system ATPase subunit/photorepair protein PhrA